MDQRLPDAVSKANRTYAELGDRFHRERVPCHLRDFACNRVMLPNWNAPLHPLRRPAAGDFEAALAGRNR